MKSDKNILRAVRVEVKGTGSSPATFKTYDKGEEDELAEVLSKDEAKRLVGKGYLAGNWDKGGVVAKK